MQLVLCKKGKAVFIFGLFICYFCCLHENFGESSESVTRIV